jgi:PKD repeat protein
MTVSRPAAPAAGALLAAAVLLAGCDRRSPISSPRIDATLAATATAATMGVWEAPFAWPIVAVHLALLPNGKVLAFGRDGDEYVWNPATNGFSAVPAPSWVFCAGHDFLPDGRLLMAGGHLDDDKGIADANIFDYVTQSWTPVRPMTKARWYPTSTTLANGEVLTIAGTDSNKVNQKIPEVWQANGEWRYLTGAPLLLPYYPRTFVAPNGKVFYAGEWPATKYLDASGTGKWTNVGNNKFGKRDYGSAVMYAPGKVLIMGGAGYRPTGSLPTATAEVIDLNGSAPAWRYTGSMNYARRQLNATILPDGKVLVTGGTAASGFSVPSGGVLQAEIWDPDTEQWTVVASNAVIRAYHSTTLLLPDGRVIHAGSGDATSGPDQKNGEFYSPPYLFDADGTPADRPTITTAPASVEWGSSFAVETPQAAQISRVTLVRLGAVTHAFNMGQRFQSLSFSRSGSSTLTVSAPTSGNIAPPGYYMLFVLDADGTPSVAKMVRVGDAAAPPPPPPPPPPPTNVAPVANAGGPYAGSEAATITFDGSGSSDANGDALSYAWNFGDGRTGTGVSPSVAYDDAGSYTATLTVTDPGSLSNSATSTVTVAEVNPTATFTAPASITEGSAFSLSMSNGTDVSVGDRPSIVYSFDCDQGAGETTPGTATSVACGIERDNRSASVRGIISNRDGATTYGATVTVKNLLPVASVALADAGAPTRITSGETVTVTGRFTDKGVNDGPWSYSFNWADGTAATTGSASAQNTPITVSHVYYRPSTEAKPTRLTFAATDKDGGIGTSPVLSIVVDPLPLTYVLTPSSMSLSDAGTPNFRVTIRQADNPTITVTQIRTGTLRLGNGSGTPAAPVYASAKIVGSDVIADFSKSAMQSGGSLSLTTPQLILEGSLNDNRRVLGTSPVSVSP